MRHVCGSTGCAQPRLTTACYADSMQQGRVDALPVAGFLDQYGGPTREQQRGTQLCPDPANPSDMVPSDGLTRGTDSERTHLDAGEDFRERLLGGLLCRLQLLHGLRRGTAHIVGLLTLATTMPQNPRCDPRCSDSSRLRTNTGESRCSQLCDTRNTQTRTRTCHTLCHGQLTLLPCSTVVSLMPMAASVAVCATVPAVSCAFSLSSAPRSPTWSLSCDACEHDRKPLASALTRPAALPGLRGSTVCYQVARGSCKLAPACCSPTGVHARHTLRVSPAIWVPSTTAGKPLHLALCLFCCRALMLALRSLTFVRTLCPALNWAPHLLLDSVCDLLRRAVSGFVEPLESILDRAGCLIGCLPTALLRHHKCKSMHCSLSWLSHDHTTGLL